MMKKKTIIIAEAGVNHNGNVNIALKLIDKASLVGADYIKFQHTNPNLISPFAKKAKYQLNNTKNKNSQKKMIEKLHLNWSKYYGKIIKRCRQKKIKFLTSAFSVKDYLEVKNLNMDYIKIPSGEIINEPLLRKISFSKKKIILSTGMSSNNEILRAITILNKKILKKKITLMHCVSDYPTKNEDINLNTILHLQDQFKTEVGFSDHSLGIDAPAIAVALGAKIIEKHFTLSKKMSGPDHRASLDPKEFSMMVKKIRKIEKILGKKKKIITENEKKTKLLVRQSLHAIDKIKKGEKFTYKNIALMRPTGGAPPSKFEDFIGKKAKKKYFKYEQIK